LVLNCPYGHDVLVGILASVVAIAYWRGPSENADLVFAWNLFGLADLVVAVTAGFLTSPSPFQLFAFDLPNELIRQFPLVLVPVFLVPVSVLLHLASPPSSAGVPCATTTVAKPHVLRRDPGLSEPQGFES
jgi:hypothetical protein